MPALIGCCTIIVACAYVLRWPAGQDSFHHLRNSVAEVGALLPVDSPVSLRVAGLSEDHFNYLRYLLIPRPLEVKAARASRLLLLTAARDEAAATDRLNYERPDLKPQQRITGPGYSLTLFKQDR